MAVGGGSNDARERAIVEWAARWSAHDLEGLLRLFTEDVVYEDVPMGVVHHGLAETRTFAGQVLAEFPDITFDVRSSFVCADRGGAEWVMSGLRTLPGSSAAKQVEVRGASMFEFAGDRIRRCADYWDMAAYLEQLR